MRILIFIFILIVSTAALAEIEPKCNNTCLKAKYYSTTCSRICDASSDTEAEKFKIAHRQFVCLQQCDIKQGGRTLTQCIEECKEKVNKALLAEKESKMNSSIKEVDEMYEKNSQEAEKQIDDKLKSHEVKKPEPLVIE